MSAGHPSVLVSQILAEVKQAAQAEYGDRLASVILFGSQARGDAAADSDVDILIVLHGTVNAGREIARFGAQIAALSLHYDVVLSCLFISAARYDTEQSALLLNVRREGIAA